MKLEAVLDQLRSRIFLALDRMNIRAKKFYGVDFLSEDPGEPPLTWLERVFFSTLTIVAFMGFMLLSLYFIFALHLIYLAIFDRTEFMEMIKMMMLN